MEPCALGMMQGRLSPIKGGKIQKFPWQNWKKEPKIQFDMGIFGTEWTIDLWHYYKNPLIKYPRECLKHFNECGVKIWGVTSDAHMHGNFWTEINGLYPTKRLHDLTFKILQSLRAAEATYLVIPLVDDGKISQKRSNDYLVEELLKYTHFLRDNNLKILFEVDFLPQATLDFIQQFPEDCFGINYDMGNSASMGLDPVSEISLYGSYIKNVHVKDRPRDGTNCLLGKGSVDFKTVIREFKNLKYNGKFVLQTGRSEVNNHKSTLQKQINFWATQWEKALE